MGESKLVVGYESALEFWRAVRVSSEGPGTHDPEGKADEGRSLVRSEQVVRALVHCGTDSPIKAVVTEKDQRHGSARVEDHVWRGPLADQHLLALDDDIFVCRMPVVFAQLAATWDVIDLAELACEMAGTYGLTPWLAVGCVGSLPPLVDLADLMGYAVSARAAGARGAARAMSALALASAGSRSPRETDVSIFFREGRPRGGAGVGGFSMNQHVELPPELARRLGRRTVVPGFSWDNGTIVEYGSDQAHQTPDGRARDESKRLAYQAAGLDCLTLTNGILGSDARLNLFVEDLERSLHLSRRPMSERMRGARSDLRLRLFGPESPEEAPSASGDAI